MAATVFELSKSPEIEMGEDSPSAMIKLGVFREYDPELVLAAVDAFRPDTFLDLPYQKTSYSPQGAGVWEATCRYGSKEPDKPGDWSVNFDTAGGTQRIFKGLTTPTAYTDGVDAEIDFEGAIGVTDEGGSRKVEGVDVDIGGFSFTATRTFASPINPTYLNTLKSRIKKVNSDAVIIDFDDVVFAFPAGSLKIDHASGGRSREERWKVTIKATFIENVTGLTFGDITGVDKKGHQYLWVYYEDTESANTLVRRPRQVMVETVYEEKTLAELFA